MRNSIGRERLITLQLFFANFFGSLCRPERSPRESTPLRLLPTVRYAVALRLFGELDVTVITPPLLIVMVSNVPAAICVD